MRHAAAYSGPERACDGIVLRPPLAYHWSFGARENPAARWVVVDDDVFWPGRDELVCLGSSGEMKWNSPGDFGSGLIVEPDGIACVVSAAFAQARGEGDRYFARVSRTDGSVIRRQTIRGFLQLISSDAVVFHEEVAASSGVKVRLVGYGATDSGIEQRWMIEMDGADRRDRFSLAATSDQTKGYMGWGSGAIASIDLRDGSLVWKADVSDLGGKLVLDAHLESTKGVCVVATKAWTGAFDAKTGKRLWSSAIWGARVVYGDRVYVVQDDTFYAFDLFDGAIKFRCDVRSEMEQKGKRKFDRISTHIAASDTHIWGGDPYGTLWAFNRETGRPEWHHRPKDATGYSGGVPAISGNRLYIPSFSMDPRFPPSLYCYEQA